jgi:hypothetical protein
MLRINMECTATSTQCNPERRLPGGTARTRNQNLRLLSKENINISKRSNKCPRSTKDETATNTARTGSVKLARTYRSQTKAHFTVEDTSWSNNKILGKTQKTNAEYTATSSMGSPEQKRKQDTANTGA